MPIRDRIRAPASVPFRDSARDSRDPRHSRDARDARIGVRAMEFRQSVYDQYREEPPAKYQRLSPPVQSGYGRQVSRTTQYDEYDQYGRYEQYDQYDHRSLNRHGTFNEPAVHSSEPHTAGRLPASDEAQGLVLRLSNLSDALFPSTATAHDVPA